MKQWYYTADAGSVKLIHKSGASILLHNGYGDGFFKYYVFDSYKQMEEHIASRYAVKESKISLRGKGWKVMDYDCTSNYDDSGTLLESEKISVYQVDQCFMFVLNKASK